MSSGRIGPGERLEMTAPQNPPPKPPTPQPIGLIGTGALYVLDRRAEWDNPVDANAFKTRFIPGTRILQLSWRDPPKDDQLAEKSLEKARRALDLMSIGGGGHYRIPHPWQNRLLWRPNDDGIHLHAATVFALDAPLGMMREHRDVPEEAREPIGEEGYNEAFRYFRLAQVAPDPFYAFRNMWLVFENLLSQASAKEQGMQNWIKDTLKECKDRYDPIERENLLTDEALEEFTDKVYVGTRNLAFHSKDGKGRYVPASSRDEREVEEALELLTRHVLALARVDTGWPLNVRPMMDVELAGEGGELLGDPVRLGFYQYSSERQISPVWFKLDTEAATLTKRYAIVTETADLRLSKHLDRIDGMLLAWEDPVPNLWSRFDVPLSAGNVTSVTVTGAIRSRLKQVIKTAWTTEEEPLQAGDL